MAVIEVEFGVLFSRKGSYGAIGAAMHAGALLAVEEVNADASLGVRLIPRDMDPGGDAAAYVAAARLLLGDLGVTHVVGCYTSSSRKELLPYFEKHDALLWYPSHYEGFETSDNVIYTGAGPNQHVIPLTRYLSATCGLRGWFVGSNYIWAWENNRIMRETLQAAGGAVFGEPYFPVGETDLSAVVAQILDHRPSFVFNTLIGESAYAFYRTFRAEATRRGIDQARDIPVASCSLAEPELAAIGPDACDGHLSSSVYFSTVETPENARFVAAWRRRFPELGLTSADAEASYVAVHLLARALRKAGVADFQAVRAATAGLSFCAPQGPVRVDAENRHCHMAPRIGRSTAAGDFEIVFAHPAPVRPDPYLVWETGVPPASRAKLRIVS
jgi:branched-chain amino acid transport system substrate-binding protein